MKCWKVVDVKRGGFLWWGGHTERYIELEAYNELMSELMRNTPNEKVLQQVIEDVTYAMVENQRKNLFVLAALQMIALQGLKGFER